MLAGGGQDGSLIPVLSLWIYFGDSKTKFFFIYFAFYFRFKTIIYDFFLLKSLNLFRLYFLDFSLFEPQLFHWIQISFHSSFNLKTSQLILLSSYFFSIFQLNLNNLIPQNCILIICCILNRIYSAYLTTSQIAIWISLDCKIRPI